MGTVQRTEVLPIKDSSDVVFVRQRVRVWALELKLSLANRCLDTGNTMRIESHIICFGDERDLVF